MRRKDWRKSLNASGSRLLGCGLMAGVLFAGGAISAPTAPSTPTTVQERISEVARSLQSNPKLKKLTETQRENVVNFIVGNMLFVMLHELGHGAIEQFKIPILGREEDTADNFAIIRLLEVGSAFSHRILVEATRGWFLSDRRDRDSKEPLYYYDEHGLDKQRAYQIVCIMVGSDPVEFKDLADQTKMPDDRQSTCKIDYDTAFSGWSTVLKPDLRSPEQPKTKIDVTYGDGQGTLDVYAQGFRSLRMLEAVRDRAADLLAWPTPFTLEMQTCGVINGMWQHGQNKLTLCYELAADFADLYRYNDELTSSKKKKRKSK